MTNRIGPRRRHRSGFTLVELLTVIAIIALLAALLFPIFGTINEARRKAQCKTQIQDLIRALKQFKEDNGRFPEALYGATYNGGPLELTLGDAKYNIRKDAFTCPNHSPALKASSTLVPPQNRMTGSPATDTRGRAMAFPQFDSYDFQYEPSSTTANPVLHYTLKWTAGIGLTDDPRQLIRKDPPGNTIVTWCMNHCNMDSAGVPAKGSKAIVGLLNGQVVEIDADKLYLWPGPDGKHPWQAAP